MVHRPRPKWEVRVAPRRRPQWLQRMLIPIGFLALAVNELLVAPLIVLFMWLFARLATFAAGCVEED